LPAEAFFRRPRALSDHVHPEADRTIIRAVDPGPTDAFGGGHAEQLAELDFEGQAARESAAQAPAAPPAEEAVSAAPVSREPSQVEHAEYEPTAEEVEAWWDDFAERIEELADEDPLAAADTLAHLYAMQTQEQLRAEVAREMAPVRQREFQAQAADTIHRLESDFGAELMELHREALYAAVSADPQKYTNPATRDHRLRETVMALEYARQQCIDWEAYTKAEIDERSRGLSGQRKPPPSQVRGLTDGQAARRFGEIRSAVHVEGGSGPQPRPGFQNVDPDVAAIDSVAFGARDAFGRLYR
jgi:hypothetical protein